ncbi:hypothetical protein NEDG_01336 [Nematocida displodere]|uniref:J domain-containing protein n=1 Tax=Nematocida displodere TaxID=1805483 RepID=A0A177EBD6_9MICR|nr:hypothetical protein NEDG_01336 [Nematocida displodere]
MNEEVQRILASKHDYYGVLQITKESTPEEVRRKYKQLAVKVHPDRNTHEKASDAFVVLNQAYEEMKDGRNKNTFRGPNPSRRHHPRSCANAYVTPEEELEAFIRNVYRAHEFGFTRQMHPQSFSFFSTYERPRRAEELTLPSHAVVFILFMLLLFLMLK